MLTVTSVNVNGIRAAAKKGFGAWLEGSDADVVCLQEVRAEEGQIPEEVRTPAGWHTVFALTAAKGRAGVALYTRRAPERVQVGFGSDEFDASGRYLEIDLPGVTVASLYLPSGEAGTEKQDEKYRFMAEFHTYLRALKARAAADGREVVVCGDWNICHQEADLKNWKTNRKNAGFLPEEREWLGKVYGDGRLCRRGARAAPRHGGPVLLVVLPWAGLRQRRRLAHRPPGRDARAGREGGEGVRRARRDAPRALVRPRARDRRLRAGCLTGSGRQEAVHRHRQFGLDHALGQRAQAREGILRDVDRDQLGEQGRHRVRVLAHAAARLQDGRERDALADQGRGDVQQA